MGTVKKEKIVEQIYDNCNLYNFPQNGYPSRRRSLVDDARFESLVVKQTKQLVLEEARSKANGKSRLSLRHSFPTNFQHFPFFQEWIETLQRNEKLAKKQAIFHKFSTNFPQFSTIFLSIYKKKKIVIILLKKQFNFPIEKKKKKISSLFPGIFLEFSPNFPEIL